MAAVKTARKSAKPVVKQVALVKPMLPKTADLKYTGHEPDWTTQPTSETRTGLLTRAFTWYNYHYDKKDAKALIIDWLARNDRTKEAKAFHKVGDTDFPITAGWLCRMNVVGLVLTEHEELYIDRVVSENLAALKKVVKEVTEDEKPAALRVTIQDRLKEKMADAAGEIEGVFDEFIKDGAKMSASYKPIAILRSMNVAPQLISGLLDHWKNRLAEFEELQAGKDKDLVEGYSNFSKIQVRNIIKFCEQVIADCSSYVQIKKVERKPRAKKPVSPEKLSQRFKYLKEDPALKLKSEPVAKLVNASEAWLYDTKKRKLIYVVADSHVGTFTVKGSALIGFDATLSVQKTLRKPVEQIKSLMAASVPNARKMFKDIKTTEIKFNGRGNDGLLLLKIR